MPNLDMAKLNSPKTAVNKDTLRPPAKTAGSGSPRASNVSKAVIKPITDAKKPITKPSKLLSIASLSIFLESALFDLFEIMPLTIKKTDNNKQIRIRDIKKTPPSWNLSTNGFETTNNFGNNDVNNTYITDGFMINMFQT
jgi:hypothetical protein